MRDKAEEWPGQEQELVGMFPIAVIVQDWRKG